MLDVAPTELLLVAVVALVVIGPKDLPRAMRFVGQWVAKARGVARHFRSGLDEMVRQAELEEMEKKWAAENERIMREHPPQLIEGTAQNSSYGTSEPAAADHTQSDHGRPDHGQMVPLNHQPQTMADAYQAAQSSQVEAQPSLPLDPAPAAPASDTKAPDTPKPTAS